MARSFALVAVAVIVALSDIQSHPSRSSFSRRHPRSLYRERSQGNCNLTRTRTMEALIEWMQGSSIGVSYDPDILLAGDFNACEYVGGNKRLHDGHSGLPRRARHATSSLFSLNDNVPVFLRL